MPFREAITVQGELKKWLVRRVECTRGSVTLGRSLSVRCTSTNLSDVHLFPAFDYARGKHVVKIVDESLGQSKAVTFSGPSNLNLQLDVVEDLGDANENKVVFRHVSQQHVHGVVSRIALKEGQAVSFILRDDIPNHITRDITTNILDTIQHETQVYWNDWIAKSRYKGRWREIVNRSLMILKLLSYEPTGAIIAAPTFSIPEDIGGVR